MAEKFGKKKQENLQLEFLYKQIFDHSPEVIVFADPRGTIQDVNKQIFDWLGYSPEEIIGKNFLELDFFDKKARTVLKKKHFQRVEGGELSPYNLEVTAKDGKKFVGQFVARLIKNDRGESRGILGVITDITKQAEQTKKFRDISEKNRALFQAIPDLVFIMRKDGTFLEFKADRDEDLAVPPDRIVGSNIGDFGFSESFLALVTQSVDEAFRTRQVQTFEYKMDLREGPGFYECRLVVLNEQEVLAVIRNITRHKELDEEFRLKNTVFETSLAANSTADIRGFITYVNQSFLNIWGYRKKSEVIGRHISDFFLHREEAENIIRGLSNIGLWRGVFRGKKKDGTTFSCHGFATAVHDSKGEVMGFQSTNMDMDSLKSDAETTYSAGDEE